MSGSHIDMTGRPGIHQNALPENRQPPRLRETHARIVLTGDHHTLGNRHPALRSRRKSANLRRTVLTLHIRGRNQERPFHFAPHPLPGNTAQCAKARHPRLCATIITGPGQSSTAPSSRSIHCPQSGVSQSLCSTQRQSGCSARQIACQCAAPEPCQPGTSTGIGLVPRLL